MRSRWAKVASWCLDIWTVATSLVDVTTDILVLQYYKKAGSAGRPFFIGSVVIFVVAQATYALLFCSSYARREDGIAKRVAVFLVVLPVSQLVPIFTWAETSFNMEVISRFLLACGLEPTRPENAAETTDGVDQLWSFVRAKYSSHAGFLAEAIVEALPQAILQTYSVVALGQAASPVVVSSVLMSVTVLGSKSYVVSYSIDRLVCIFNSLCFVADLLAFFATACWLGSAPVDESALTALLVQLFAASCALLVAGAATAHVFVVADDHLKQYRDVSLRPDVLGGVWFELYLLRGLVFACGVLPLATAFASARLVAVPLLIFGSLDPEHASHYPFYAFVFHFLQRGPSTDDADRALRLEAHNDVVTACRRSAPALERAINNRRSMHGDAAAREQRDDVVRRWAKALASPNEWRVGLPAAASFAAARTPLVSYDPIPVGDLVAQPPESPPPQPVATGRRAKLRAAWKALWADLVLRSDILSFFDFRQMRGGAPPYWSLLRFPARSLLLGIGVLALVLGFLVFLVFAPFALAFELVALIFAPAQLVARGDRPGNPLAVVLTVILLVVALLLCFLAPHCHVHRQLCDGLADASDLPPIVYDAKPVRGALVRRYLVSRARTRLHLALSLALRSTDLADDILDNLLEGSFFWFPPDATGRGRADLWQLVLPHLAAS